MSAIGTDLAGIQHDDHREFRGLRFATAARLQAPVDIDGIETGVDGTTFAPQSPQTSGALESMLGATELDTSENCLALNIATPACDDRRRPVLVFIHGGAFVTGTGAMPWYDGGPLARRGDVVVVTINYRLGALGFLGDRNLGSLDQVSALRWIQRNIARFGGDPDRVTIFGESAGGAAVVSLFATPGAQGLFRAGWAMSPSLPQLRSRATAERLERKFLDGIGETATADDLLSMTIDEILDAQSKMAATADLRNFAPTEGTEVFPNPILDAAVENSLPLVIGATRDEMLLFTAFDPQRAHWDDDDVERQFARRFGDRAAEAIEQYRAHRPGSTPSQLVSAMQTDETFRQPAQSLAERRTDGDRATWMYTFDQSSSAFGGVLGSCHGLDIPFAFDTLSARGARMFTGSNETLDDVADQFSSALISFAHHGDPGWPAFDTDRRATRRIGPAPDVVDDPEPELRRLWPRADDT